MEKSNKIPFDINKLDQDAADKLSEEIGVKIRKHCDEACEKANKILNVYGMKAQMQFLVQEMDEDRQKASKAPKPKRGRPRKAANL